MKLKLDKETILEWLKKWWVIPALAVAALGYLTYAHFWPADPNKGLTAESVIEGYYQQLEKDSAAAKEMARQRKMLPADSKYVAGKTASLPGPKAPESLVLEFTGTQVVEQGSPRLHGTVRIPTGLLTSFFKSFGHGGSGSNGDETELVISESWGNFLSGALSVFYQLLPALMIGGIAWWVIKRAGMFTGAANAAAGAAGDKEDKHDFLTFYAPDKLPDEVTGWESGIYDPNVRVDLEPLEHHLRLTREAWQKFHAEQEAVKKTKKNNKETEPVKFKPPRVKSRNGRRLGKKLLLVGPPGTGKTLLAIILARVTGCWVVVVAGSAFDEELVGRGAKRVRYCMAFAREMTEKYGPGILVIDEADMAMEQRTSDGFSSNKDQTTTEWLTQLDGFGKEGADSLLTLLGTTNYVKKMDKAALRPSRFGEQLQVNPPNQEGREKLFALFGKDMTFGPDVNIPAICSMLGGKTGDDFKAFLNHVATTADEVEAIEEDKLRAAGKSEAAIDGILTGRPKDMKIVMEGLERSLYGRVRNVKMTKKQEKQTIYHEGGHGLLNAFGQKLDWSEAWVRVLSVLPRDKALGYVMSTHDGDRLSETAQEVWATVIMGFAGSAMQMLVNDDRSKFGVKIGLYRDTGPDRDFSMANDMIHKLNSRNFGSFKLGPISVGQKNSGTALTEMGEAAKNEIDKVCRDDIRLLFAMSYYVCRELLKSNRTWEFFAEVARKKVLLQERFYTLFGEIIEDIGWDKLETGLAEFYNSHHENPQGWTPDKLPQNEREFINQGIKLVDAQYESLEAERKQREADDAARKVREADERTAKDLLSGLGELSTQSPKTAEDKVTANEAQPAGEAKKRRWKLF